MCSDPINDVTLLDNYFQFIILETRSNVKIDVVSYMKEPLFEINYVNEGSTTPLILQVNLRPKSGKSIKSPVSDNVITDLASRHSFGFKFVVKNEKS